MYIPKRISRTGGVEPPRQGKRALASSEEPNCFISPSLILFSIVWIARNPPGDLNQGYGRPYGQAYEGAFDVMYGVVRPYQGLIDCLDISQFV